MTSETRAPRVDAQRNREAVIDAALDLLARNPNASMQTIAERSGVGRTTVYRHFPTRVDLVRALFQRVVDESREVTTRVIDLEAPTADVMRALGPALIGIGLRFKYLQGLRQMGDEVITESTFDPDDPVRLFFVAAIARGDIRAELPLQWILSMISSVTTATLLELHAGRLDAQEAGEILGETFVRIFATEAAQAEPASSDANAE